METPRSSNQEQINALTRAIKQAKNDSQRFATLLAVSKMLKAEELTEIQRKDIFLAIGFSFPIRLLTSTGDSDCPKAVFNDLGLSILSSFVSDTELTQAPEHKKIIPIVLKIMTENAGNQNKDNLFDCFCYLVAIATVDYNCLTIVKHNGLHVIINAFCSDIRDEVSVMFWSILHSLVKFDAETVWSDNKEHILFLLEHISKRILTEFSEKKFELFDHLSSFLSNLTPEYAIFYNDKKWIHNLRKSLFEVLCSRISSKERTPSLRLCHHLTELFGLNWTISDQISKPEKKFPVLLIKLVCVELHLVVHNWLGKKDELLQILDSSEMPVFVVCCALFEAGCSAIASFDSDESSAEIFSYKDIEDIQGSLSETVEGIVQSFLPEIMPVPELKDLVLTCLRTIGSWLNVSLFATSKTGLSIIETVFSAFKTCLEFEPSVAIKTLTPAFLHYAENDSAKNQLLNLSIISCLSTAFVNLELADESKCLCSQCLMAFCVESQNLEEFDRILPDLIDHTLTLDHHEVQCYYASLLSLMVWNKRCNPFQDYPQSERFFQNLIRLLHNIHAIQGNTVKVSKRFSSIWNEIEELWFILVKELIRAAQNSKEVREYVLLSRFPNKINDLLSCKNINPDVADNYHLFDSFLKSF